MAARLALLALLLALPGRSGAGATAPSEVRGVVQITGLATNAGAVVSLQAEHLAPAPPAEPVTIEQKGFRFVPRLIAVQAGTTIRFRNGDPEPHDVYSPEGRCNLGVWPTGESRDFVFERPGAYRLLSTIHPEMLGFVVVLDTPLYAITDEDGSFAIRDVPPGRYRLAVWHEEKDGLAREIAVESGKPLKLELVVEK